MIRTVPLALLLLAGRVEALEMPSELHLIPALVLTDPVPPAPQPAPEVSKEASTKEPAPLHLKSPWEALGLTALVELPTLFVGPSLGHLYAGEETHFWITGGARLGALGLLLLLEVWGPGIGPLYAVTQPGHAGASFSAYPVAYTVDLLLVLGIIGSAIYDLIDAPYAALRYNARVEAAAEAPHAMAGPPGWTVATF